MNFINNLVKLIDRQIVAANRKRSFQNLFQMSDRELEDIGLPRERLYAESANQKRHATTGAQAANNAQHAIQAP